MGLGLHAKRWRRTVAGLPTATFRDRLVQMCSNTGLSVVAVDPAHTTRWGEANWRAPLDQQTKATITVSRHQAAAVVIGRRSLGHRAGRRPDVTDAHPRGPREIKDLGGWTSGWAAGSYRSCPARTPAAQGPAQPRRLLRTPGGGCAPPGAAAHPRSGAGRTSGEGARRRPRSPKTVRGGPTDSLKCPLVGNGTGVTRTRFNSLPWSQWWSKVEPCRCLPSGSSAEATQLTAGQATLPPFLP